MDNITAKVVDIIIELGQEEFLPSQSTHKLCWLIPSRDPEFKTGASLFQTELNHLVILCILWVLLYFYIEVSADFMQCLWVRFKFWKCDTSCCFVWGYQCIYIYGEPAIQARNCSLDRCEWCLALEQTVWLCLPRISHLLNIPERILTSHLQKTIRNMWRLHVLPFSDSGFPSPVVYTGTTVTE